MLRDALFEIEICVPETPEKNVYISVIYAFACHVMEVGHI